VVYAGTNESTIRTAGYGRRRAPPSVTRCLAGLKGGPTSVTRPLRIIKSSPRGTGRPTPPHLHGRGSLAFDAGVRLLSLRAAAYCSPMSSGPANVVMDREPGRPAAVRQRIKVSPGEKRLLEAASRTPAVLEKLNIQWQMTPTVIKPVAAKVADIGAAALRKLLGTVNYLGPPFAEQVDATHWCLPDRTPGPAAPSLLQLPSGLRAAVGAVIDHARGTAQQEVSIWPALTRARARSAGAALPRSDRNVTATWSSCRVTSSEAPTRRQRCA